MKTKISLFKHLLLTSVGILLISASVVILGSLPSAEACGNNPNCPGGWSVSESDCSAEACSCGSNTLPYKCFRQIGTCNADGSWITFTHCYQGNCCCPSGNCAGQSTGGGGGGGGGDEAGCATSWECFAGEECCAGACQEHTIFGCLDQ
jgi:hypothetical protein